MNRLTEQFFHSPTGVFTQSEVSAMVPGTDHSRYGLVKRALAKGEVLQIRRGLYCLAPFWQRKPINSLSLAQQVHGPSYLSLETALNFHGWIPEAVYAITSVSFGPAKEFDTPLGLYSFQRVPQTVFLHGVERHIGSGGEVFLMATAAKALADYVYLNRLDWISTKAACEYLRIERDDLLSANAAELEGLIANYRSQRVKRFLKSWQKELNS